LSPRGLTVVVSGMVAGTPRHGGATWAVLQWVLGLRDLGHDVWLVEPVAADTVGAESASYADAVMRRFGLEERWALLPAQSHMAAGAGYATVAAMCARADVLFNVSGMLDVTGLAAAIPVRVYVDLDPGFNQLWHEVEAIDMRFDGHTHWVTVGTALGTKDCPIPIADRQWIATVPPVVLDQWPSAPPAGHGSYTTIANWRGYGSVDHGGVRYGQKAHSWRGLMTLPARTGVDFEVALAIHPDEVDDLAALRQHGWRIVDPVTVAGDPMAYQAFVRRSRAEIGIAKSGYVLGRTGWFSDRSVCYLASGHPVIAQETGFSRFLPTGTGLFAFTTVDDVLAGIAALKHDYAYHARAARAIAEEYFDSDKVLTRLLQAIGALS